MSLICFPRSILCKNKFHSVEEDAQSLMLQASKKGQDCFFDQKKDSSGVVLMNYITKGVCYSYFIDKI